MKIKSIRKVGPELYQVIFQRWFMPDLERYAIIDKFTIESKEYEQVAWRDVDKLAEDVRPQIEWMIRHNVDYFNNYPGNGVSLMIDNRKK